MPNGGYQFGATCTGRGLASTWAKGDARALPLDAATPGVALLRATVHAAARADAQRIRVCCDECRGRGWIITRGICGHGDTSCA